MPSFATSESVAYSLALTVPAIVFMFMRAQLTHGRMPKASDAVLQCIAMTAAYYGVAWPLILLAHATSGNSFTWWLGWVALLFVFPAILGLLAGWSIHSGALYNVLRKAGLKPVHSFATAWEWRFSNCPGEWVVVTLRNGNSYGAECASDSFISTAPDERDIYLESTYDIGDDGKWTKRNYGMLIKASEISTIEFSLPILENDNGT